jgi:hypothetical protein
MPLWVTLMHHIGHQHEAKKGFALAFGTTVAVSASQQGGAIEEVTTD